MDRITRQCWQNELYRFYGPYYTSVLTEWVIKVLWTVLHVSVDKMSYKGFMDRITRQCWQNELQRFYGPYYTSVLTEWVIKVLWTVLHVSVDMFVIAVRISHTFRSLSHEFKQSGSLHMCAPSADIGRSGIRTRYPRALSQPSYQWANQYMSYKGFMDRITRECSQNELYRFYGPYYTSVFSEWVIQVLWPVLHVSVDRMSYTGFMDRITRQCWQNEL